MRSSDETIRLDHHPAVDDTRRLPRHRSQGGQTHRQGPDLRRHPARPAQTRRPAGHREKYVQAPVRHRPATPPPAQPTPPKKKRQAPPGCGCLVTLLVICLALAAAFAAFWFFSARQVPAPIDSLPASEQKAEAIQRAGKNTSFLLVGDDERTEGEQARSDTMLYMVMRPVDKKISLVSLPRDSLVTIPGHGEDKLNAAFAYGGMDLLLQTVTDLIGPKADHTVLVNFTGFEKMVNAVGGVTIDVPQKMYKPEEGIDLEAGRQKLNGHDALAFVRWRDDGLGDIGRMERQKEFMAAFAKECRFLWPWQAVRLGWALHNTVDTDLSLVDSLKLVVDMAGMGPDAVQVDHFDLNPQYINNISYVLLDPGDVRRTIERVYYGIEISSL